MWFVVDDTYTKCEVGGLSTYTRFMVEAFLRADIKVVLLSQLLLESKIFRVLNFIIGYKRSINLIGLLNIDLLRKFREDFSVVYFDTYHYAHCKNASKIYITVHDLSSFYSNTGYGKWAAYLKYKSLQRIKENSSRIKCVSISQKTQTELRKFFALDSIVVHNPLQDLSLFKKDRTLASDYFLMIGSYHIRKGFEEVINKWDRKDNLIIAGRNLKQLEGLISSRIILQENVDTSTLSSLVNGAKGLIWNSKDEGFGMPVFECLKAGLPVYSLVNFPIVNEFSVSGYQRIRDVNNFDEFEGLVDCESKFPTSHYNEFYEVLLFN